MPSDERTPLLHDQEQQEEQPTKFWDFGGNGTREVDFHKQFCRLVGIPPSDRPDDAHVQVQPKTLYGRALALKKSQGRVYQFTAWVSNSLLLAQVVLGATLTALGASESSHVLITLFGVMNTIIAGVVAYLKSQGQPMRARSYRDDLERVVDEIENSEIMWLGISKHMLGYDDIDTDKEVTVRSEVARLTRLYDRAVRNNTLNNPDMYMAGTTGFDQTNLSLRPHPSGMPSVPGAGVMAPASLPMGTMPVPAASAPPGPDDDASPATAPPKKDNDKKGDKDDEDKKPATGDKGDSTAKGDSKAAASEGAKGAATTTPNPAPAQVSTSQDNLDDEPEPAAETKPEK